MKLVNFLKDAGNVIDIVSIFLFLVSMIRFIPNYNAYNAARILLSFDILFWFFKFLYAYSVFRNLGPKLVMIGSMVYTCFCILHFIFVLLFFYNNFVCSFFKKKRLPNCLCSFWLWPYSYLHLALACKVSCITIIR